MIRVEKKEYRDWPNTWFLSNDAIELVILADVGPRVMRYAFRGGENQFHEIAEHTGLCGGGEFRLYGGHRLWAWPEVERTYYPDNGPVSVTPRSDGATFTAPIESAPPGTSLQRQISVTLDEQATHVKLIHTISNHASTTTELAVWTPTVLRPGGRAILPFPPRAAMDNDHFQSVSPLTLWSFTDFTDSRWILGQEFLQLVQQEAPLGRFPEQMSGLFNSEGWGAYVRSGCVFLKRALVWTGATYPDFGCNFEIFTNAEFLELETLGPIVRLQPGESTQHTEHWWLFDGIPPITTEDDIRFEILPLAVKTAVY
ncbi:MAG TPA: hypothetical protein VEI54_02975 [Candidatus Limnocylindrales bacterium]|nr:hypothetical protein [Candidatus Limnocylindrales bacterium]